MDETKYVAVPVRMNGDIGLALCHVDYTPGGRDNFTPVPTHERWKRIVALASPEHVAVKRELLERAEKHCAKWCGYGGEEIAAELRSSLSAKGQSK